MTPYKTDHQQRLDIILGIVVNQYIGTVTPVGSSYIASQYNLDLSSATIRNVLAELEQKGYLTHPHTSAGRIPTELGYRYYVDNLMNEIELLHEEKERIKVEYDKEILQLENLLEKTSEVVSELTNYTSIISIDGQRDKIFCRGTNYIVQYSDYKNLEKIQSILRALEEKRQILDIINRDLQHRIDIYIGNEVQSSIIDGCSLAISSYKTENGQTGRIAVLGPTRMNYQRVVSTLDYITDLMREVF